MLLRFVPRSQWEKKLLDLGARPLPGIGPLNTAEWWRVPGRTPFTVPVEADGACEFWALQKIIQQQGGSTPFSDLDS